jgi:hypothetical protein
MKIELSSFGLTPREYFRVLLRNYLSRRWWLLLIDLIIVALFILALVMVPEQVQLIHYIGVGILVAFPLIYVLRFRRVAFGGVNEAAFQERRAVLDDEGMYFSFADGEETHIPWGDVHRVLKTKDFLLVYIDKRRFAYLPKRAFPDAESLSEFLRFAGSLR